MDSHLIGNDPGKGGLTKSGWSVEQHMIQCIPTLFCCGNIDLQVLLYLGLTDIIVQRLGT